jgi:hypothetical protein
MDTGIIRLTDITVTHTHPTVTIHTTVTAITRITVTDRITHITAVITGIMAGTADTTEAIPATDTMAVMVDTMAVIVDTAAITAIQVSRSRIIRIIAAVAERLFVDTEQSW